jgi:hypothetical protein
MGSLQESIESLINEDIPIFQAVQLHQHDGCTQVCCAIAMASFRASVIAASARCDDGLQGVLDWLNSSFAWGVKFETHLCGILQSAPYLDCGAMVGIAFLGVKLYQDYERFRNPQRALITSLMAANVEVILKADYSNVSIIRQEIKQRYGDTSSLYSRWLRDEAMYHQCIGLYSPETRKMMIWDYKKWVLFSGAVHNAKNDVVAIRVNPLETDTQDYLLWDGKVRLPVRTWVLYPDGRSQVADNHSTSYTSHNSGTSINAESSCTKNRDDVANPNKKKLIIYISGCHMSINPMAGVSIARSLRLWFDQSKQSSAPTLAHYGELQLVGVDDSVTDNLTGLTDLVFDQVRTMMVHGRHCWRDAIPASEEVPLKVQVSKSASRRELDEDELWEAVVSMMSNNVPHINGMENYPGAGIDTESFFIPVSYLYTVYTPPLIAVVVSGLRSRCCISFRQENVAAKVSTMSWRSRGCSSRLQARSSDTSSLQQSL